jgi:hypothetical protein
VKGSLVLTPSLAENRRTEIRNFEILGVPLSGQLGLLGPAKSREGLYIITYNDYHKKHDSHKKENKGKIHTPSDQLVI